MANDPLTDTYYQSRYTFDRNRTVVWKEIVRYLSPHLPKDGIIVDLGAGYCDFINNVQGSVRYAVDTSPDLAKFVAPGVTPLATTAGDLAAIPSGSVDVVHASNLFEHFTDEELEQVYGEVKRVLKKGGLLILLQPNYRYAYKTYFDDPTHKKVFSDEALATSLVAHGFDVTLRKPRFLPFSMKSRPSLIPVIPLVVRAYMYSPVKPSAGQMLLIGRAR